MGIFAKKYNAVRDEMKRRFAKSKQFLLVIASHGNAGYVEIEGRKHKTRHALAAHFAKLLQEVCCVARDFVVLFSTCENTSDNLQPCLEIPSCSGAIGFAGGADWRFDREVEQTGEVVNACS